MYKNHFIEEVLLIIGFTILMMYLDYANMGLNHFGMYSFEGNILVLMPVIFLILIVLIFYIKNFKSTKK